MSYCDEQQMKSGDSDFQFLAFSTASKRMKAQSLPVHAGELSYRVRSFPGSVFNELSPSSYCVFCFRRCVALQMANYLRSFFAFYFHMKEIRAGPFDYEKIPLSSSVFGYNSIFFVLYGTVSILN